MYLYAVELNMFNSNTFFVSEYEATVHNSPWLVTACELILLAIL